MPAFQVLHEDEELAVIGILDAERNGLISVRAGQFPGCLKVCILTADIPVQIFRITFPPPVPSKAIDLVFKFSTGFYLSISINRHNLEGYVFVRLVIRLLQVDSHIMGERGESHGIGDDARIPSRLRNLADQIGLEHTRCIVRFGHFFAQRNVPKAVQPETDLGKNLGNECLPGIREGISAVFRERNGRVVQNDIQCSIQIGGDGTGKPVRFNRYVGLLP